MSSAPFPLDGRAAEARLWSLERERRRIEAEIVELLGQAESSRCYQDDGHLSVRSWAMATAGWSVAEAGERVRAVGLTRSMPLLAEALAAGDVPLAHLHTLGRVWGNRRVRDRLGEFDELLTGFATTMTHRDFAVLAHRWEANADADGTRRDQRAVDEARDASIRPVGDEYVLAANVAAAQGTTMAEIFDAFTRPSSTPTAPPPARGTHWHAPPLNAGPTRCSPSSGRPPVRATDGGWRSRSTSPSTSAPSRTSSPAPAASHRLPPIRRHGSPVAVRPPTASGSIRRRCWQWPASAGSAAGWSTPPA